MSFAGVGEDAMLAGRSGRLVFTTSSTLIVVLEHEVDTFYIKSISHRYIQIGGSRLPLPPSKAGKHDALLLPAAHTVSPSFNACSFA